MGYASGARITLLSQWGRLLIQIAGFVLLARLLTPEDFGLAAMVTALVAFAALLSDFGLSIAGVQAKHLTRAQGSALFYLNALAGAVGAIIVAASGPLLAGFYGESRVAGIAAALSLSLFLTSLSVQLRVELNRRGRFAVLAAQDLVGAGAALAAAVSAAAMGAGYWALVVQGLVQPFVILFMSVIQARWIPGKPAPLSELRSLLVFGTSNFVLQLVNLLSRTLDQMMVGREQGADQLGIYGRASQLVTMIFQQVVTPLTRVVLPMLARTVDNRAFNELLRSLQLLVAYGLLGALSIAVALADPLIPLVLGEEWRDVVPVFRVLAAGAAFSAAGYIYYWATLARARSALLMLSELPGRLVMISAAIGLAQFGVIWVAIGVCAGQLVSYVIASVSVSRAGVDAAALARSTVRPALIVTAACGLSVLAGRLADGDWVRLVVIALAWLATLGLATLSRTVRGELAGLWRLIKR